MTVTFDGGASSDPDAADTLSYAWDLNADGITDATTAVATSVYNTGGTHIARLTVSDNHGLSHAAIVSITVDSSAPTAVIDWPASATLWRVGDTIAFSGQATDPEEGTLPPTAMSWSVVMNHCSSLGGCHVHPLQDFLGVSAGSFVAPDHEYPSHLELRLTATDSSGLQSTATRRLDPQTVLVTFATIPSGLQLGVGSESATAPFTRTVIVGIEQLGQRSLASGDRWHDPSVPRLVGRRRPDAQRSPVGNGGDLHRYIRLADAGSALWPDRHDERLGAHHSGVVQRGWRDRLPRGALGRRRSVRAGRHDGRQRRDLHEYLADGWNGLHVPRKVVQRRRQLGPVRHGSGDDLACCYPHQLPAVRITGAERVLVDAGAAYASRGNGLSYGWNAANNQTRDRNSSRSPDQRYDTLNHMQRNGSFSWSLGVPNGSYTVRVVAGDSDHTNSYYRINVESTLAIDQRPTSSSRWVDRTVTVTVSDGRLSLSNASGSSNNRDRLRRDHSAAMSGAAAAADAQSTAGFRRRSGERDIPF